MSSSPAPESLHPAAQQRLGIGERELVVMMALTQALQALAVDAMLPALGDIARDLHLHDPNRRQLVIGLFLLGSGLGSLIPGTLADRFGRRRVLLSCIGGYVALTLACTLVTDFTMLVVLRVVQGMFCAGLTVIPPAIIRDRFEGDRMARLQSMISVIFLCVPMIAPSLGQAILLFAGWRFIFTLMAGLGVAMGLWLGLRLPETLRPEFRQAIHPTVILGNIGMVVKLRESIGYVLGSTVVMGALWGYIQCSQQLVAEHFGAGRTFPLFFGGMALAMAAANFTNSRIVERFGARRVSHTALVGYIAISIAQFALAHGTHETLWQFAPLMTLTMMLMGFMGANFGSIALQPFARIAGAAASVQTFLRLVIGSLIGAFIGQSYDQTARPFSDALVLAGIASLVLVLWSERGRLFRRVIPRGEARPVYMEAH